MEGIGRGVGGNCPGIFQVLCRRLPGHAQEIKENPWVRRRPWWGSNHVSLI